MSAKKIICLFIAFPFIFSLLLTVPVFAQENSFDYFSSLIGQNITVIKEKWGEPTTKKQLKNPNNMYGYFYEKQGVTFYLKDNLITAIIFIKPTFTFKEITIGSNKEKITKSFGTGCVQLSAGKNSLFLTYTLQKIAVSFYLVNDRVERIVILQPMPST